MYIDQVLFRSALSKTSYLNHLPAVRHLQTAGGLSLSAPVTFFVGENGTGKSTLLEAIAVAFGFNPEGGSRNFNFSTRVSHSELCDSLTLVKSRFPKDGFFLRAESVYNVATNIEELDSVSAVAPPVIDSYGGVSLHDQSHGESFLSIVQHRFHGNGLYLLDEPEAALSPTRTLTLLAEIYRLTQNGSQFLIATHSPILMALPGAEILEFSQNGIHPVDYRQTEHYCVTREFLNHPEKMLEQLLS